jgi:hypothetical protein
MRAPRPFDFDPIVVDTGLVQIDGLRFDEARTAEAAAAFYSSLAQRVEHKHARSAHGAPISSSAIFLRSRAQ